jgi:ribosomal protein S18 acetylase RimI-like enzyme
MEAITLHAVTDADTDFLRRVYASTRVAELAMTPWSDEQKEAFCRMQFDAQRSHYEKHYPAASHDIIQRGSVAAGRLYVDRGESEILIVDIALLPEHRGAGIGTKLLRELQEEARAAGKTLSIHVEKFNPALRLYERLGFLVKEDTGVYLLMEWRAG